MNSIINKPIIIDSKEDVHDYLDELINDLGLNEEIKYELECKYLNQLNYERRNNNIE